MQTLKHVVLPESENERTDTFEWQWVKKHRVLVLGPVSTNEDAASPGVVYRLGLFRDSDQFTEEALIEPAATGRKATEIPFVFINAVDVVPAPDVPPLLGLSNLALTFYRGQADYRQSLFMQGQDTLVVIGGTTQPDEALRIGAGARIDLPLNGDAKYIGVEAAGLEEQRLALENDNREAQQMSGQLLEAASREKESGEALKTRMAARTATLVQVAHAGAFGLQEALRKLARWFGADPEAVKVTPNLDFADQSMTGKELGELMAAKAQGAPLSLQTVHDLMANRGLTEKTFDEEIEQIEAERELELAPVGNEDPDGPEADPEEPEDDEPEGNES